MVKKTLVRFGVSIEGDILARFDARIAKHRYTNRSEALRDLMRAEFVQLDWEASSNVVVGIITLVYDHHKRGLVNQLLNLQHDFPGSIICSQHVHLEHSLCLEVLVATGQARQLRVLADEMKAKKGVQFSSLNPAGYGAARPSVTAHNEHIHLKKST
ncbi:MAG: putative nickel-responsive regulator [Elusimicrobia bacterium]|nr:putative nickel-responsive regulator [Elusimicrobiota bacterium]